MYTIDAEESDYLYTELSLLPNAGNGLHTAIPIFKGEIIALYRGEILSDEEAEKRAAARKDQYFVSMLDGSIMDSIDSACWAKFANDAEAFADSKIKNNAKITVDEDENVCLMATRKIKAGEEIFCGYGKRYWKNAHQDVQN